MTSEVKEQEQNQNLAEEVRLLKLPEWYVLLDKKVTKLDKPTKNTINEHLIYLDGLLDGQYQKLLDCVTDDNEIHVNISNLLPVIWEIYGIAYYISLYLLALQSFLKESTIDPNKKPYKNKIQLYFADQMRRNLQNTAEFNDLISQCFEDALKIRFACDADSQTKGIGGKLTNLFRIFYTTNNTAVEFSEHINAFNLLTGKFIDYIYNSKTIRKLFPQDDEKNIRDAKNRLYNSRTIFYEKFQNVVLNILYPEKNLLTIAADEQPLTKNKDILCNIYKIIGNVINLPIPQYRIFSELNNNFLTKSIKRIKQNPIVTISAIGTIAYGAAYVTFTAIGISLLANPIGITIGTTILIGLAALWLAYGIYKCCHKNRSAAKRNINLNTETSPLDQKHHDDLLLKINKKLQSQSNEHKKQSQTPVAVCRRLSRKARQASISTAESRRNSQGANNKNTKHKTEDKPNILDSSFLLFDKAIATFEEKDKTNDRGKDSLSLPNLSIFRRKSVVARLEASKVLANLRDVDRQIRQTPKTPTRGFIPKRLTPL